MYFENFDDQKVSKLYKEKEVIIKEEEHEAKADSPVEYVTVTNKDGSQVTQKKRGRKKDQTLPIRSMHASSFELAEADIIELRRRNLSTLIQIFANGNVSTFSTKFKISRASLSQLLNGKKFTNTYARKCAESMGLPLETLDIVDEKEFLSIISESETLTANPLLNYEGKKRGRKPKKANSTLYGNSVSSSEGEHFDSKFNFPIVAPSNANPKAITVALSEGNITNGYFLEKLDVEASAGLGAFVNESYIDSDMVFISHNDFNTNLQGKDPGKLKVIKIKGDSMNPVLHDGQSCVVELLSSFITPAIYVFTYDDQTYIKRLEVVDSHFRAVSTNPNYPPFDIKDISRLCIHGRLVLALNYSNLLI